jgi:hypothetical protein
MLSSISRPEYFHTVNGKYLDRRLNFTTSTDARFTLGVISQSRNPGWQDELRESLDISPFPTECSKMLWNLESKCQRKTEERREESERRTRRETRSATRPRTAWGRRGEDDCYFRK